MPTTHLTYAEALWLQYEWEMWAVMGPDDKASYPFIASFLALSYVGTFILSLYINLKGVSKRNPNKN